MKTVDQLSREEIITAINKDWMTHDGLWFFHSVQKLGIDKANELNLAAIEGLASAEIYRIRKLLEIGEAPLENYDTFKKLFQAVKDLFIPDFMGATVEFRDDESVVVGMQPGACFAYKGMQKLGVIEKYSCGVLYRIECMFRSLGIQYQTSKRIGRCLMHFEGSCQIEFRLDFS